MNHAFCKLIRLFFLSLLENIMKAFAYPILALFLAFSIGVQAANPAQIIFMSKKKTLMGTPYKIYQVRCTDGSKGEISYWEQERPWCIGVNKKKCYTSQVKAAEFICK
jgi:hypothetical protein